MKAHITYREYKQLQALKYRVESMKREIASVAEEARLLLGEDPNPEGTVLEFMLHGQLADVDRVLARNGIEVR